MENAPCFLWIITLESIVLGILNLVSTLSKWEKIRGWFDDVAHLFVYQRRSGPSTSLPRLVVYVCEEVQDLHSLQHVVERGFVVRGGLDLEPSCLAQCPDDVRLAWNLAVGITCNVAYHYLGRFVRLLEYCRVVRSSLPVQYIDVQWCECWRIGVSSRPRTFSGVSA